MEDLKKEKARLAIVTSHPIQYNAPWFRLLAQRGQVQLKVFYTLSQAAEGNSFDAGFNRTIEWDIPLLDGYDYIFVRNTSPQPSSYHFKGIVNPTLNNELESWKPNAILIIGWAFKSHWSCMKYFHGKVPILFRGDSTLLDKRSFLKSTLRSFVLRYIYSKVDVALFVGENNKSYYRKFGVPVSKLYYLPHAIDIERFSEAGTQFASSAKEWRREIGIKDSDIVFLFAGKLESKKNPISLLEAFSQIDEPGTHLIMVGNGVEERNLKARFANHPFIHFIDFQNQQKMPVVYRMADIVVLPSQGPEETWGLAINEAMACSKAVLVSNKCGGFPDLVDEGKNGYVFESGNLEDLKSKMCLLLKQKIQEMGKYSFDKVQKFSFSNICNQLEALVTKKV